MVSPTLLCFDGLTDTGNRRRNNEDAWWAGQLGGQCMFMEPASASITLDLADGPVLLLVSDGIGGANAGEVASQMATTQLSSALAAKIPELTDAASAQAAIRLCMEEANTAISKRSLEPGFDGMGATLSLLCFASRPVVCWGHAGDSRIYRFHGGQLRQLTLDHSPIGRLRRAGKLNEAEARTHPLRNQIDQSLGDPEASFAPEIGAEPVESGDIFLICSDGLSDGLWDKEIAEVLGKIRTTDDVRPAVQQLISRAKASSGRDNITATLALVPRPHNEPPPSALRRFLRFGSRSNG